MEKSDTGEEGGVWWGWGSSSYNRLGREHLPEKLTLSKSLQLIEVRAFQIQGMAGIQTLRWSKAGLQKELCRQQMAGTEWVRGQSLGYGVREVPVLWGRVLETRADFGCHLRDTGDMVCHTVLQAPLQLLLVGGEWGLYRQEQGNQLGDYCSGPGEKVGLDQMVAGTVVGADHILDIH